MMFYSALIPIYLGVASAALATVVGHGDMAYGFERIEASPILKWVPCFDYFTCSKLEVPIDYSNTSLGTIGIAFIKLAGQNATGDSKSIIINPGGPGGSGIDTLISYRSDAGKIFGEQYNFVSFDPRGVNNSGLALDCFSGNVEAKAAFTRIHRSGSTNTSSTVLETQYYATSIIGEWCNHAVQEKSPYSYYVTTPAVTRDIITYIEAEAESSGKPRADAKLWYYGLSYGTVIGTTFAVMFPERIGRLILDGVVDAEEYYTNNWRSNIAQDDEMVASFASFCHEAGSGNCSFWGPSPENITCRLDNIISQLEHEPVPLSGVDTNSIPTLATSSDLKALILSAGYEPLISFPQLADVLSEFERGNATGLGGVVQRFGGFSDASNMIKCADTYTRNKVVTIGEWKEYVEYTTAESRYVGDIYPIGGDTIACRGFRPNLPDSMIYQGPLPPSSNSTTFPILFASNTIDPITPIASARRMSKGFPGSVVLTQEAVGASIEAG